MKRSLTKAQANILKGGYLSAIAIALVTSSGAQAQSSNAAATEKEDSINTIVVSGSRIERKGFDAPTPTTVIGQTEIQQSASTNLAEVLNEQPAFRSTVTPQVSVGNTASGTAPIDLRGLGSNRTLTLVNGRRFVGNNNLNYVPTNLIGQVEVVTGSASAAWGSGAIGGVVNIILNDNLEGLSVGGDVGISSRGDKMRYGFDASFGTSFADGAGHFMIGGEYVKDKGILDRNSRSSLRSTNFVSAAGGGLELVDDVNFTNQSADGVINSGIFAGQTFNPDGTLRPWRGPDARGVGGADAIGLYDVIVASTPIERASVYARASYEIGNAKLWADVTYGRSESDYAFIPDFLVPEQTIQATNPFLNASIRSQLATAGETSFTFGRFFNDALTARFDGIRESKEGAIGIDGTFGSSFKYSAYYSHGEVDEDQSFSNARLAAKFNSAINAVSSGGQIVCAINADLDATNNDPACVPINPFGRGNVSAAAVDYVTGEQRSLSTTKLDSLGAEIQGDLFSLWAGPITAVVGIEARWEEVSGRRTAETLAGGFGIPLFTSDLNGGFNVKEAFTELAIPLLDIEDKFKLDFSPAARYSDYSTSGGIWSWKLGGTAQIFNDILLRVARSRDIRSPSTSELFSARGINIGQLVDQDRAGRAAANALYNPNPTLVQSFNGGNPDLVPETSKTLTFGGTVSPSFFPGFKLSVDYYDINIAGAIGTLSGSNLTRACSLGSQSACDRVIRDATGTVIQVFGNSQNLNSFETSGIDFEASYMRGVGNGNLRIRALATYVDKFIFDSGLTRIDTAGDVGASTLNAIPHWRANLSVGYDTDDFGTDVRVRYVGGGNYDSQNLAIVPSSQNIDARTYVDFGLRFKVQDKFTLYGNVNNLFDEKAPLSPVGSRFYDTTGTYFTVGARAKF